MTLSRTPMQTQSFGLQQPQLQSQQQIVYNSHLHLVSNNIAFENQRGLQPVEPLGP